jgi:hypothetical protein
MWRQQSGLRVSSQMWTATSLAVLVTCPLVARWAEPPHVDDGIDNVRRLVVDVEPGAWAAVQQEVRAN